MITNTNLTKVSDFKPTQNKHKKCVCLRVCVYVFCLCKVKKFISDMHFVFVQTLKKTTLQFEWKSKKNKKTTRVESLFIDH